ncbi:MAG: hypothetical protein L0331_10880, partial [Chloroflexi bacterium]|nr:hypothetical protein [Chloroflexota bacterium]
MSEETLAALTWLIPAGPLLAFFLIVLFTHRNKTLSWIVAWAAIIASLIMGWTVAFTFIGEFLRDAQEVAEHPT